LKRDEVDHHSLKDALNASTRALLQGSKKFLVVGVFVYLYGI
jgi:hypothetical protein